MATVLRRRSNVTAGRITKKRLPVFFVDIDGGLWFNVRIRCFARPLCVRHCPQGDRKVVLPHP